MLHIRYATYKIYANIEKYIRMCAYVLYSLVLLLSPIFLLIGLCNQNYWGGNDIKNKIFSFSIVEHGLYIFMFAFPQWHVSY